MTKPLNILILSDGFASPAFKPRLRALCNYLTENGHSFTLFSEKADPLCFERQYNINEIALYKGEGLVGKIDWAVKNVLSMLFNWKERTFTRRVEKATKDKSFDLVFCTTFHSFPLHSATCIAAKRHIPCIVDLRDIIEQAPANQMLYLGHQAWFLRPFAKIYLKQNLNRRNRELKKADVVTTVSPWHVETIQKYNPQTRLIYNGYDEKIFYPKDIDSEEFTILYTGKIFPYPQQDTDMFFQACSSLDIPMKLIFYTDHIGARIVSSAAERFGLTDKISINNFVAMEDVPDLLRRSSVCLVLTNRASDSSVHGMMTTKFFEALGVEKPILCVRSDEECLEQVINQTNAGIAVRTAEEASRFILEKYKEWKTNGFTHQKTILKQKQLFSRQKQSEQFVQLFEQVVKNNKE